MTSEFNIIARRFCNCESAKEADEDGWSSLIESDNRGVVLIPCSMGNADEDEDSCLCSIMWACIDELTGKDEDNNAAAPLGFINVRRLVM
jgi:hypothetical protein